MTTRVHYTDPDFRRRPKTRLFCYQCQKDLKPDSAYRMIFIVESMSALHPDDVAGHVMGKDDLGWLPIGSDCARRLGLEWSKPRDGNSASLCASPGAHRRELSRQ